MTGSGPNEATAEAFEQQCERLVAVAYRMLGSRADAEDSIDNLAGWLTTVVGRVCIDVLRSRKRLTRGRRSRICVVTPRQ